MFYNGIFQFFLNLLIIIFTLKMFYNIYESTALLSIGQISSNDSIFFLNIISSPIYTIFFFIVVTFLVYFFSAKNLNATNLLLFFITIFYLVDINFVKTAVHLKLNQASININLYNGLLNIHPYIIYISYSFLLTSLYLRSTNNSIYLNKLMIKSTLTVYTLIIMISIVLGAW